MSDLASIFSGLQRHHLATAARPLPDAAPGITWIVAANGVFKRGVDADRDVLIQTWRGAIDAPGLASLLPHVRWPAWPQRLPAFFLAELLADARKAMSGDSVARPIEKQYFVVYRDDKPRLIAPGGQNATPGRVSYPMPTRGAVLCDLHSHHEMGAYFSQTDDRDDMGLSVSAVVGHIFTRPEIVLRLNCYGHRQLVPATLVFDGLGPFRDGYERRRHADAAA